jgi:hypothetical protein
MADRLSALLTKWHPGSEKSEGLGERTADVSIIRPHESELRPIRAMLGGVFVRSVLC